jgi:heat shock protein HtpX
MTTSRLNRAEQRRHKLRNIVQSVLLLGGMLLLLSACTWLVFGVEGLVWSAIGWAIALLVTPRVSPRLVLEMYRARPISPRDLPVVYENLRELARRAGLPRSPALYYIPSPTLNAFTLGNRQDAAIAVTDGMLRALDGREFSGVLAHEVSHVRSNDLWVMSLAEMAGRLTRLMSIAGIVLLLVSLSLLLVRNQGGPGSILGDVPWLLVGLLVSAPTIGNLLQLALSRAREFDADLDAAGLTGDPLGLAFALEKLERSQGRIWERLFMPGPRIPDPSLLRSHPSTKERIRRLLALHRTKPASAFREPVPLSLPTGLPDVRDRPRRRLTGWWY